MNSDFMHGLAGVILRLAKASVNRCRGTTAIPAASPELSWVSLGGDRDTATR